MNDEQQFLKIYRANEADLGRFLISAVRDVALAEDILQEVWTAAWKDRVALVDHPEPRAWLFTVGRNRASPELRRSRRAARSLASLLARPEEQVTLPSQAVEVLDLLAQPLPRRPSAVPTALLARLHRRRAGADDRREPRGHSQAPLPGEGKARRCSRTHPRPPDPYREGDSPMTITEREARELVRPLEALPTIEARHRRARKSRRRHPLRLALAIGAIGLLGTGSAVAAIENFSGDSPAQVERQMTAKQRKLQRISGASDQELSREIQERSGGSISPAAIDPESIRESAQRDLEIGFPDELRFYDDQRGVVHVTNCSWPHPNRDCTDPITAIAKYPGAKLVETWSNGEPIAGGG
jgi:hypothetical protein